MSLARLAFLGAGLAAAATFVPKVAPDLVASFVAKPGKSAPVVEAARSRPAVEVERRRSPSATADGPGRHVTLRANGDGHFVIEASVNARRIEMMVDTGATTIALTEATARRLGIYPARRDFTVPLSTANGVIKAAPVMLDMVDVDGIAVRHVKAVVVPGKALAVDLLGMSYLGRLSRFQMAGGELLLVQ